jgi:YesN/AraC family two-component response regulator
MIDLKLVHEYTKNLHILYVEDNEALRESTLKVLHNFFQHVDAAFHGREGVDKYKTFLHMHDKPYDLVISDINMPHLNGIEMSEKILEIEPHQSIIFITAHNEIEYLHKAIKLGISSFLLKPLNLQDLASVLYKVCQAITDRALVQEHYKMIEDMNQQLENQNQALEEKNREQERLLRLLDTIGIKTPQKRQQQNQAEEESVTSSLYDEKEHSYYEQIEQLIREDLPELQELHESLDSVIISIIDTRDVEKRDALIAELPVNFSRYASILGMYSSFEALTLAMQNLTKAMLENPLPKDESQIGEIFSFLEAFMYILGKWQKDLLAQDGEKIKQLDVSIIGDLETITNMWLADKEEMENSEVEFF